MKIFAKNILHKKEEKKRLKLIMNYVILLKNILGIYISCELFDVQNSPHLLFELVFMVYFFHFITEFILVIRLC